MENDFLSGNDIIQAIARGLQPGGNTIRLFIIIFITLVILIIVVARYFQKRSARKTREAVLAAFEKKIRKLDLTINEIDYLNRLSTGLKKPWKKYLLLTNKSTFTNSVALLQAQDPGSLNLDLVRSISRKAGFEMASLPKNKKGTWKIFPGSPLKIVAPGGILFAGEATQTNEETFDFHTYEKLPDEARDITVFIVDFSGINGFQTRLVSRKENNHYTARHSDTPRSLVWENPGKAGVADEVFILSDDTGDTPVHARLKSIRPGWIILSEPAKKFRKGQDIRIFLTQKLSGGFWVNGEVSKLSKDGKSIMVRLNHVKSRGETHPHQVI